MPVVRVDIDVQSITNAINQVREYQRRVQGWADRVGRRLADMGYQVAIAILASYVDTGATVDSLEVVRVAEGRFILRAESEALLFLEFGAGITFGYGHPMAGQMGMGAGTYPSESPTPHWDDPNGWRYPKNGHYYHTMGNPPYMPFYEADQEIIRNVLNIAREELRT